MWWATGMAIIGLGAGILSGLFGIGGGILVIPSLIFLFGMDQKIAQGTTLLMLLPPIGLFAAMEYLKRGEANWHAAIWICLGFLIGGFIGAKLVGGIPPLLLRRGLAIFIILVGVRMLIKQ